MKSFILTGVLMLGLLLCSACEEEGHAQHSGKERVSGPDTVESLRQQDLQAKTGRSFVYMDPQGRIHRSKDYNSIPLDRRSAVIVVDGKRRGRLRQEAGGRIKIEALPPLIRVQVDGGMVDAGAGKGALDPNLEEFRRLFKEELERQKASGL